MRPELSSLPAHSCVTAGMIFVSAAIFLITTALNGLAGSGAGVPSIFYSTVGDISDKYQLFITPAGFTFTIWSVIYLWLAVSLLVIIITIFINTQSGRLYLSPSIASPAVTVTLSANFTLNLAWIFIWDRSYKSPDLLILASIVLFLIAISNILVVFLMAKNIEDNAQHFSSGSPLFWWGVAYRVILNGLALYTTWTVIASLINLTTALVYAGEVGQREAALAALTLLVIFHSTWFLVENFVVDRYARYILTPYLVVIWATNGIRARQMADPDVPQDIEDYVLAILVIAAFTLVLRLCLITYSCLKTPVTKMS